LNADPLNQGGPEIVKLVALADLHGDRSALGDLDPVLRWADVLLLVGDITHFGSAARAQELLGYLTALGKPVLAVAGNCDPPDIDRLLTTMHINLHGRRHTLPHLDLVGLGGALPGPRPTPFVLPAAEQQRLLARSALAGRPGCATVLVSHEPPYDTQADRAHDGTHVGSRAVREYVARQQTALCLCGHIHESAAVDCLGDTVVLNPGPARDRRYAWAVFAAARLLSFGLGSGSTLPPYPVQP
jgi:hypothetical protein